MASFAVRRSTGPVLRTISPSSALIRRAETPSAVAAAPIKRTCLCSPTNHPGSFRCSLHKGGGGRHGKIVFPNSSKSASCNVGRLNSTARRSAVKKSIGTAEGDLVKRALVALIRPSSGQQKRRRNEDFRCRPSRLSVMSKA